MVMPTAFEQESEFNKWFANPINKRARELAMERSGVPLEMRTRRRLRSLGYSAIRDYYEDGGIARELDILADKLLDSISPYGLGLSIYLLILGECKRSETHDFFAFQSEESRELRVQYPLKFYTEGFPRGALNITFPACKPFAFPFIAERIVEVDATKFMSHKDGNYGDKMTYEACETLAHACRFFRKFHSNFYFDEGFKEGAFDGICEDNPSFEDAIHGTYDEAVRAVEKITSEKPEECSRIFSYFTAIWGVPILVLDDNRGLVNTRLRNDGTVSIDGDLEVVLYPYLQRDLSHSDDQSLPIVVCKYKYLEQAVNVLETGARKIVEQFKRELDDDPTLVLRQLMMTQLYRFRQGRDDQMLNEPSRP